MKNIVMFVTSAHLLMILLLLFSPVKKVNLPAKHIAVRTVQPRTLSVQKPIAVARPVSSSPKQKAAPVSSPKPKSQATPPAAKKQTGKPAVVEKGKKTKVKAPPPEIFKQIDEALAKIDEKGYSKPHSKLELPHFVPFQEGSAPEGPEETLVAFFHDSLNLPEFGEVKIQLTVKKDGTVAHMAVLQAESKKNRAYLEQHLPLLRLPLKLENEKTFTLTFCNEI